MNIPLDVLSSAIPLVAAVFFVGIAYIGFRAIFNSVEEPKTPNPASYANTAVNQHLPQTIQNLNPIEPTKSTTSNDEGFATSMVIGMATDNAILGAAVGGNLAGAMIGEAITDSSQGAESTSSDSTW